MTTTQRLLAQLEQESAATRQMLSVIPDDKFDWQPHPRSMTISQLATHIAELPGWVTITLTTDGLDLGNNPFTPPLVNSRAGTLAFFEEKLAQGRASLQNATDEDLAVKWTMSNKEHVISVRPKEEVIRMALSQIIHHRAQMGVFLRLLDVPIPGSYGPSADEMMN